MTPETKKVSENVYTFHEYLDLIKNSKKAEEKKQISSNQSTFIEEEEVLSSAKRIQMLEKEESDRK